MAKGRISRRINTRPNTWIGLLGYPVTSYFCPRGRPAPSASTLAMMTLSFACENASASCSYVGARFWRVSYKDIAAAGSERRAYLAMAAVGHMRSGEKRVHGAVWNTTYHHGAKLKVPTRLPCIHMDPVPNTHNSTRPGLPLPITPSKLSGPSSRTLEAVTLANTLATKRERESRIAMSVFKLVV